MIYAECKMGVSVTFSISGTSVKMGSSPLDRPDLLAGTSKQKELRCSENALNIAQEGLEFANTKKHFTFTLEHRRQAILPYTDDSLIKEMHLTQQET